MTNQLLNEKGSNLPLTTLRMALKIADKTNVPKEEFKKAKLDEKTGKWENEGTEKEIELSDDQVKLLIEFIDKKDEEKGFSMSGGIPMLSLIDKVKGEENA